MSVLIQPCHIKRSVSSYIMENSIDFHSFLCFQECNSLTLINMKDGCYMVSPGGHYCLLIVFLPHPHSAVAASAAYCVNICARNTKKTFMFGQTYKTLLETCLIFCAKPLCETSSLIECLLCISASLQLMRDQIADQDQ